MWFVYEIVICDIRRYVGITSDLVKRQTNHNWACFKGDIEKELYLKIKTHHPLLEKIELKELMRFNKEVDARRWECLLILSDYFNEGNLWQKIPIIMDGGVKKKYKKK